MDLIKIKSMIKDLAFLDYQRMCADDFLLTWEKSDDEIQATFLVADILRGLRQQNISCRLFDSNESFHQKFHYNQKNDEKLTDKWRWNMIRLQKAFSRPDGIRN